MYYTLYMFAYIFVMILLLRVGTRLRSDPLSSANIHYVRTQLLIVIIGLL